MILMLWRVIFLIMLMVVPLQLHAAVPVKARPLTGIGLLCIPAATGAALRLTLYKEPGMGRLHEAGISGLALLQSFPSDECLYLPVIAKKQGWLKVIHDDAERSAWANNRRGWMFQRWEEFLTGRKVTVLKGIRKDYYQLRKEPLISAEAMENSEKYPALEVLAVAGDWISVTVGNSPVGWLRWRDDNGRLLLQLKP